MTDHLGTKGICTMLTKTKITLVAALLLGSASSAFAIDPDGFDVDIFRPRATARVPSQNSRPNGFVQAPARLGSRAVTGAQSFSAGERNWMDRASAQWGL
jgi:hypothetical protein